MKNQSIKSNAIYNTVKTVSAIIFPLISFPYISHVLLADNLGKINFGLSIISYFSLIATLGINTYAIRECSLVRDNQSQLETTASQIFSINVVTTFIAYCLLLISLLVFRSLDNYRTLIIIQSFSIAATTLGADWLNSAMEDFKFITIRTIAFQFLSLILLFIFVHKPDDYYIYAIICLVSSSGASIVNVFYRKRYCRVVFTLKMDIRRHFNPILLLFVMLLAQNIFNNVDSTMLGLMIGDREVGIYGAAHRMYNIINQVVASVLWVIIPRMSYYFNKGDYEEINGLLRKVLGFNFLIGLPCATGAFILSNDIVYIIAGSSFLEASSVLRILICGFMFTLIGGNFLGNAVLLPSKNERYYMIVCCITALINVVTNYFLIPYYGAKGAAFTTSLCSLFIFILLLLKKDKRIKIRKMLSTVIAPIIGSITIVLICLWLSSVTSLWKRVSLSIIISAVSYFSVQVLLKNELLVLFFKPILKKIRTLFSNFKQ